MTTDRRFCRFNKLGDVPFSMPEVPEGGLCLSAFLVLTEKGHPDRVLLGHLDPAAPWDHIGALDPSRTAVHSKGWMLPSSHLIVHESPDEAARRIAVEQLGRDDIAFGDAKVVSEIYTPRRFPDVARHWDLEFLFRAEWPDRTAPRSPAWSELRFVEIAATPKADIARSHEDVLASAGFTLRDG